jgi:hypothetical protein
MEEGQAKDDSQDDQGIMIDDDENEDSTMAKRTCHKLKKNFESLSKTYLQMGTTVVYKYMT